MSSNQQPNSMYNDLPGEIIAGFASFLDGGDLINYSMVNRFTRGFSFKVRTLPLPHWTQCNPSKGWTSHIPTIEEVWNWATVRRDQLPLVPPPRHLTLRTEHVVIGTCGRPFSFTDFPLLKSIEFTHKALYWPGMAPSFIWDQPDLDEWKCAWAKIFSEIRLGQFVMPLDSGPDETVKALLHTLQSLQSLDRFSFKVSNEFCSDCTVRLVEQEEFATLLPDVDTVDLTLARGQNSPAIVLRLLMLTTKATSWLGRRRHVNIYDPHRFTLQIREQTGEDLDLAEEILAPQRPPIHCLMPRGFEELSTENCPSDSHRRINVLFRPFTVDDTVEEPDLTDTRPPEQKSMMTLVRNHVSDADIEEFEEWLHGESVL